MELAKNGPWGLYDRPIFVDYTPGYLYVLWALGLVTGIGDPDWRAAQAARDRRRPRPRTGDLLPRRRALAAIIKPQFGILIPLAAVVIIRRHWVERPNDGSRLGGGPVRIVTTTLAGLVTATLCLPFGITIVGLLQQIVQTAGGYPYLTVNAYNPPAPSRWMVPGSLLLGDVDRVMCRNPRNVADPFAPLGILAVLVGHVHRSRRRSWR